MAANGEERPVCLICRVNKRIRGTDGSGYSPELMSIGPLFKGTDWMKQEKFNRLKSDLNVPDHQQVDEGFLTPYLPQMAEHKERAQGHYFNVLFSEMTTDAFLRMMLLDGSFVLSHFGLLKSEEAGQERARTADYDHDVVFLFENQVPFFILKEIYKIFSTGTDEPNGLGNSNNSIVLETIARHIKSILLVNHYVHESVVLNMNEGDPEHVAHLFYKYFLQPTATPGQDQNIEDEATDNVKRPPCWRSATYYYAAGVRFAELELDSNEARSILHIKLTDDKLQIPCLVIQNNTSTILRNMVALEQCNPNVGSSFTFYCLFMEQVMRTEEDVRLLMSKGIISNFLCSDKAVLENFADLCRGITINVNSREFKDQKRIIENLEKLCKNPWQKSFAWLRHDKCNNILKTLAVVAGFFIFLFTLEQAVFAALSYFKKNP